MRKKNGRRIKKIMAWFLLIAMMFTSQNGVVSAMELSKKDVRDDESVKQSQSIGEGMSDYISRVSMGNAHTGAITENGDLYCWGSNRYGQVGNGTTKNQYTPIKVLSNVVSVSMGHNHSSAITTNGDLYYWAIILMVK